MKKLNKIVSLALAGIMSVAMLGCGGSVAANTVFSADDRTSASEQ